VGVGGPRRREVSSRTGPGRRSKDIFIRASWQPHRMADPPLLLTPVEHLTPHDLVTYSRCPHEMELHRLHRHPGGPPLLSDTLALPMAPPDRHSPLFLPALPRITVREGRLDLFPSDTLVYVDEGEDDLPMLFPPEQVRPDPVYRRHGVNLIDDEFGLSGRPDLIVRRANGVAYPVEYKSTHLFVGYHEAHGRAFDVLQAIAECRLVHATSGIRPSFGVILYGDANGDGGREGWVEVGYGDSEEHWLRAALAQIRADHARAPVPSERNCAGCEPNRESLCPSAAVPYAGPHPLGAVPFGPGHSTFTPSRSR